MVGLIFIETAEQIEISSGDVTFIFATGDLADITAINSSYSWKIKAPKTPKNTRILKGLGLVGNTSNRPYTKIYANLTSDGVTIVNKGLVLIKDTGDDYGIYIQEGVIDFLKDLRDGTVGNELDLSSLDHDRNITNIRNSWENDLDYRYLLSDVNGKYYPNIGDTTNISLEHMIPYASIKYIWDLIFSTYGWTYEISPQSEALIDDLWLSFPLEVVNEAVAEIEVFDGSSEGSERDVTFEPQPYLIPYSLNSQDTDYVNFQGNSVLINVTGTYQVTASSLGHIYDIYPNGSTTNPVYFYDADVFVNGVKNNDLTLNLSTGDFLTFKSRLTNTPLTNGAVTRIMKVFNANFVIDKLDANVVSFTSALKDLQMRDFFKEIMIRGSLTSFTDSRARHIVFKSLSERLDADIVDWSGFYVKRKKETYLYDSYAQENWLRHRYPTEDEVYADGFLPVENENLDLDKDLYTSFTFPPEQTFRTWQSPGAGLDGTYQVWSLRFFDIDTETDEETGDIIFTYKRRSSTWFITRAVTTDVDLYITDAQAGQTHIEDETPWFVDMRDCTFKDIAPDIYGEFGKLGTKSKVHEIELALPLLEVASIDLKKRYYFEQEAGVYILDSLKWVSGRKATGRFTKINSNG